MAGQAATVALLVVVVYPTLLRPDGPGTLRGIEAPGGESTARVDSARPGSESGDRRPKDASGGVRPRRRGHQRRGHQRRGHQRRGHQRRRRRRCRGPRRRLAGPARREPTPIPPLATISTTIPSRPCSTRSPRAARSASTGAPCSAAAVDCAVIALQGDGPAGSDKRPSAPREEDPSVARAPARRHAHPRPDLVPRPADPLDRGLASSCCARSSSRGSTTRSPRR